MLIFPGVLTLGFFRFFVVVLDIFALFQLVLVDFLLLEDNYLIWSILNRFGQSFIQLNHVNSFPSNERN